MLCLVFPLGLELGPFLRRVETKRRWTIRKATYREVFFEGRHILVVRCGIGQTLAAAAVRNLPDAASAIISVGTAGALIPGLQIGHLVVGSETVSGSGPYERLPSSGSIVDSLTAACQKFQKDFRVGPIITVNKAVWHREERERLHRQTGALAVEMESHAINIEAARLGIPAASLRVISDDMTHPPLPGYCTLKQAWHNPKELLTILLAVYQWWRFIKKLRSVVEALPPVLIRMIRDKW